MGNYISRSDAETRLSRVYDTIYENDGIVDNDLVDADIDAAEGEVDAYLAQRYLIPVTDSNALRVIKSWALTLLEVHAYGRIPGRELPESISTRAKTVRDQLQKAADGSIALGAAETPTEAANGTDFLIVEGDDPVMGRDNLKGW